MRSQTRRRQDKKRQTRRRQRRSQHRGGSLTLTHSAIRKGNTSTPEVKYNAQPTELFTLILYDPDAPAGTWLHWLVVNIQGSDISTGHELAAYHPPAPPKGTGTHRYFLVLMKQAGRIEVAPHYFQKRAPFPVEEFKAEYLLRPVAQTLTRQSAD